MYTIMESERRFIADAMKDTLAELEELDQFDGGLDVSQGVVDKLVSSLQILGESYE